MTTIREICKENASEFKWIIKVCLNLLAFPLNDFTAKMSTVQFAIFQVHWWWENLNFLGWQQSTTNHKTQIIKLQH